jgi:TonB family protein
MNNEHSRQGTQDPDSPEMEARIVAWVSGEASASESDELGRLAAANPGLAAYKGRVEAMRALALEAVAPDREPLKLSGERRAELYVAFDGMRRRNLAYAAAISVLLIGGVAWLGEITHSIPPLHGTVRVTPLPPFTIEPDPPVPVEMEVTQEKPRQDVAVPQQPDYPKTPKPDDFMTPIEPPHPQVDNKIFKIPEGGIGDGLGTHTFTISQLDQAPIETYKARPVYPESMRHVGISGEVLVDFIVDPSGKVRNATAVHSSQREFEESACTAVGKWKFRPGRKDGRPVYVHMQVPIVFTLSEP